MQKFVGDVRDLDCILTDPLYREEFIPLYGELARLAAKALKPDDGLAVMTPQAHLPEVLALMCPHIPYRWVVAYLTPASESRIFLAARTLNGSQSRCSVLEKQKWLCDVVKSDAGDKRYHD